MPTKLLLSMLVLGYLASSGYEITIDTPSKTVKQKNEKKHIFKRDNLKEIVIDTNSRLVWQDDVSSKTVKRGLMDAKNYCYKLTLATFNNWRLPSVEELEMIADIKRPAPSIHQEFKNVKADFYISSSPRLSDIDTILYMDFSNGHKYEGSRRGKGYVRCVRVNKTR